MYSILNVFSELAAHPNTVGGLLSTSCIVEALLQHLVLKPKRLWKDVIYPEVATVLQNLAGIDDEQVLARLLKLGLP